MKERKTSSWWVENLFRPTMIAAMMVCLATPMVFGLQWLIPPWDGTYFFFFAFLASLEGILSERALQKQRITGWSYLGSRTAEALILFLLLKLVSYAPLGLDALLASAQDWIADPYQFLTNLDMITGVLFLALWGGSLTVARMASELDIEEGKVAAPPDITSPEYYLWLTRPSAIRDRQEGLKFLVDFVLWGGVLLLIASAVFHSAASAKALAVPILLYFALGIALLGQGRFSVSYAGWQSQGIAIQPGIARRWLVWVVVFLVGVALAALLLPTYFSVGPLRAFLGILSMLYSVLSFLLALLLFLIMLPLAFLAPSLERPAPPPLELIPPITPGAGSGSEAPVWLEMLGSALFWAVVLAIVAYAGYRFWKDRVAGTVVEGTERTWSERFRAWLRALWARLRGWREEVQVRLARRSAGQEEKRPIAVGLSRFFFPGRLAPRELVRYFYLSATRRAAQAGQPREPGQTPYEYQASLERQFPELEPDLEGLTEAFVKARYSRHSVQKEDAEAVKPLWQRVKAVLQHRRLRNQ
jgi:hypothetical protein